MNLAREYAFGLTVLQQRQAIAVQHGVGIRGICVETLADDQARLPVRLASRADEGNVRRQRNITGNLFPYEVAGVIGKPHVHATTANRVSPLRRIVFGGAGMKWRAYVSVGREHAGGCGIRLRVRQNERKTGQREHQEPG